MSRANAEGSGDRGIVLRRVTDLAEALALVEPLEPETSVVAGTLNEYGLGRQVRAWSAVDQHGAAAGLVVLNRLCLDRWEAMTVVLDQQAAAVLAARVDRSPAWRLIGTAPHVAPLLPHLGRARPAVQMRFLAVAAPVPAPDTPDPRARLATPLDLDGLVELYGGFELDLVPTRLRLRRFLVRAIERSQVVVVEQDGRVAAALRCEGRSRRYAYWGAASVLPAYRGRGLIWALVDQMLRVTRTKDLGWCGGIVPSNPLSRFDTDRLAQRFHGPFEESTWVAVRLGPPVRFRGHGRLRKAWERLEGRVERRPVESLGAP